MCLAAAGAAQLNAGLPGCGRRRSWYTFTRADLLVGMTSCKWSIHNEASSRKRLLLLPHMTMRVRGIVVLLIMLLVAPLRCAAIANAAMGKAEVELSVSGCDSISTETVN